LCSPIFGAVTQCPAHLAKGKATLTFRLRHHQVCKTFHGGEIKLAVLESSPSELTGLRRTQSGHARKCLKNGCNDCAPTMNLELGNVLARLAVRRRKPQRRGNLAIASPDTPSVAVPASGILPAIVLSASPAAGPEMRITAIAAGGRPDESA
jgi:hypothetical protein